MANRNSVTFRYRSLDSGYSVYCAVYYSTIKNGEKMNVVGIKKVNEDCIRDIQALLDESKSGRVVGCTFMIEYSDGTYCIQGSATASRLQSAGMLLEAAMGVLGRPSAE